MVSFADKEIYAMVKKPTITETERLNSLCWFGHIQRMEENRMPKNVLYTRYNYIYYTSIHNNIPQ